MASKFAVINGDLYNNGVTSEMKVTTGSDVRIKASGTGSCQVVGKLTANGEAKVLSAVRLKDFASGLYSISVANANGFTNVWATVLA